MNSGLLPNSPQKLSGVFVRPSSMKEQSQSLFTIRHLNAALVKLWGAITQVKPSLLHGELACASPPLAQRSHPLAPQSRRLHPFLASGCLPWPRKGGRLPMMAPSPLTHHRALILLLLLLLLLLRTPETSYPMLPRAHIVDEETVFLRRGGRTICPR